MLTLQNLVYYFIAIFHLIYCHFYENISVFFFHCFWWRVFSGEQNSSAPSGVIKTYRPLDIRALNGVAATFWQLSKPQNFENFLQRIPFDSLLPPLPLTPWIFEIIAGHILSKREQGGSVSLYFGAILQMKEEIHWKENKWMQL